MDRPDTQAFVACEDRVVPIDDDHVMISMPYVNPTPWKTPREDDEAGLERRIAAMADGIGDHSKVIFNFHAPPKDSTLDTCPMLDGTTDPPSQVVRGGQPVLYGAGSTSIRAAIERYQPMLGLHGHIHESQAAARIGRHGVRQPGQRVRRGRAEGLPDHHRGWQGHQLSDDRRAEPARGGSGVREVKVEGAVRVTR